MLYDYTLFPLECVYKILYLGLYELCQSYGAALILLSALTHILTSPLTAWAKQFQIEERRLREIIEPQIDEINANFHGAERHKELAWLYRRYGYHPAMAARSAMTFLLQVPFLMAAYYMLSDLPDIEGISFGSIADLSEPDGLLDGANLLPFLMTVINFGATLGQTDFSRRDKIQAVAIALMFLVLLYDAPSALLVYWTGNNFLSLMAAWGQKISVYVKISQKLASLGNMFWRCLADKAVIAAAVLTLCIFVPVDIYLTNADEIWFTLPQIFLYLLAAAVILWLLLSVPTKVLTTRDKNFYSAALMGLTIALFFQSYVLNFHYGELMGAEIPWEKYRVAGWLNLLAWGMLLYIPVGYVRRWIMYPHRLRSFFVCGSALIIAAQFFPLCYVGATQNIDKHFHNVLTTKNMLDVSAKDNIIVIVLDMFDTRFFQTLQREEPELIAELEGFTYYPDAMSTFGYTDYSLPQMMTGVIYDNKALYADYVEAAWHDNKFYKKLLDENYDIGVYTSGAYVGSEAPIDNLLNDESGSVMQVNEYTFKAIGEMVMFRSLPHFMKRYFVPDTADIWQQNGNDAQIFDMDNLSFYQHLQKGLTTHGNKNSFRWYHIHGAHMPYTLTRDITKAEAGQSNKTEQAVGVFKIALYYLQQLKRNGLYDRATIVILADHGQHSEGEADEFTKVKPVPLVLVKQPGERGALSESANPIYYDQLLATLAFRFADGKNYFGDDFSRKHPGDRIFNYIKFSNDHVITAYKVGSPPTDNAAWQEIGKIPYRPQLSPNLYRLGKVLDFRVGRNGEKYLAEGWSRPADEATLSNGDFASIDLSIDELKSERDFQLVLRARPISAAQQVSLFVNGNFICVWQMDKPAWQEYEAKIPRNYLEGNRCNLCFKISNPHKLWLIGVGYQDVGFYLHSMTLKYAH